MISTQYPEPVEESSKYLRMTLQNISRYKLPYNPFSYLLWYEYATGRNQHLINDIESLLTQEGAIDEEIITRLFKKHIADPNFMMAQEKADGFQTILSEIISHLGTSQGDMDGHHDHFKAISQKLNQAASIEDIQQITRHLMSETKAMAEESKALSAKIQQSLTEIETLRKELKTAQQKANTDMLTRLFNRHGFDQAIGQALRSVRASGQPLSIIILDIDFFKRINDTYGHLVGDNVLKMLGRLIRESVKGRDIPARFGGEEFIIALPKTDIQNALSLAEQIRKALALKNMRIKESGESIGQVTLSAGIAAYRPGELIDQTIKRADDALYQAKETGRNKSVVEQAVSSEITQ